ncbi:MAG: hypothetical protein LW817_08090 [Candidatus Caenarcaniphilales bacterium]|jgi:hypothetical protein|nr:hypothetical protein [Candidatus Caenarcaniphilales bacterium]
MSLESVGVRSTGNGAGRIDSTLESTKTIEITSNEALQLIGAFIEAMTMLGTVSGAFRGFAANPLALTGGAALMLPWLSSMISKDGQGQQQLERKPAPAAKTLLENINSAEEIAAKANSDLEHAMTETRSQIEAAAAKVGLKVSDEKQEPEVLIETKSTDHKVLEKALKEAKFELKNNPNDLRLQIKVKVLVNAINSGTSFEKAKQDIYAVSKNLDAIEGNIAKINSSAPASLKIARFSRLRSWFRAAPKQTNPHGEELKNNLAQLETRLASLGVYDLDRVLDQSSILQTARNVV